MRSPFSAFARFTARIFLLVSLANHSLNKFLNGASSFPSVYIESKLSLTAIYLTLFFGKYISVYTTLYEKITLPK